MTGHDATTHAESTPIVVSRTFDAPRDLVFAAWTDVEHLKHWFGPKGYTFLAGTIDFRPGGVFHYGLRGPDGSEMWGKWMWRAIDAPRSFEAIVAFSDKNGRYTRHPMAPGWPLETLSRTTFEEQDGKTTITVRWSAYNATADERALFDASHDSMRGGLTGTFQQLEAYLASHA